MVQIEYIHWLYYRQHLSVRAIAKMVGSSRKTISRVLALEDPREHKYNQDPCQVLSGDGPGAAG